MNDSQRGMTGEWDCALAVESCSWWSVMLSWVSGFDVGITSEARTSYVHMSELPSTVYYIEVYCVPCHRNVMPGARLRFARLRFQIDANND